MPAFTPVSLLDSFEEQNTVNQQRKLADLQQQVVRQGLLEKMQNDMKKRQYDEAIARLGPNATHDQLVGVASRFAGPEKALDIHQRALDRKATSDAAGENRKAMLEQQATLAREREDARLVSAQERGANAEMIAKMRIEADERMRRFAVENRPAKEPRNLQLTADAEGNQLVVNSDGTTRPLLTADGKPVRKPTTEKALPTAAAQKLFENQQNLRRAETALSLMEGKDVGTMKGDKDATGWKGFVPDTLLQRLDPKGTDARAALADLGSLVIHDRSGAAVTAAEFPRLQPFIPKINDDPETVKKKLKRFAQIYRDISNETANFYRESGYKVPDLQATQAPATPAGPTVDSLLEKYK